MELPSVLKGKLMETRNTKQKILDVALDLFSKNGYEATSTEQIASAIGIKKSSLYSHFKNKQDILDSLVKQIGEEYNKNSILSKKVSFKTEGFTIENIIAGVQKQVKYLIHDYDMVRIRKLLTIEQYRNPQISKIQTEQVYSNVMNYNKRLIKFLIKENKLINDDVDIMAAQFGFPISSWIFLCDRDIKQESKVMKLIEKHVKQFVKIYGKK